MGLDCWHAGRRGGGRTAGTAGGSDGYAHPAGRAQISDPHSASLGPRRKYKEAKLREDPSWTLEREMQQRRAVRCCVGAPRRGMSDCASGAGRPRCRQWVCLQQGPMLVGEGPTTPAIIMGSCRRPWYLPFPLPCRGCWAAPHSQRSRLPPCPLGTTVSRRTWRGPSRSGRGVRSRAASAARCSTSVAARACPWAIGSASRCDFSGQGPGGYFQDAMCRGQRRR